MIELCFGEVCVDLLCDSEIFVECLNIILFLVVIFNFVGVIDLWCLCEVVDLVLWFELLWVCGVGCIEVFGGDVCEVEILFDVEWFVVLYLCLVDVVEWVIVVLVLCLVGWFG